MNTDQAMPIIGVDIIDGTIGIPDPVLFISVFMVSICPRRNRSNRGSISLHRSHGRHQLLSANGLNGQILPDGHGVEQRGREFASSRHAQTKNNSRRDAEAQRQSRTAANTAAQDSVVRRLRLRRSTPARRRRLPRRASAKPQAARQWNLPCSAEIVSEQRWPEQLSD
jgi:hypothetical protein